MVRLTVLRIPVLALLAMATLWGSAMGQVGGDGDGLPPQAGVSRFARAVTVSSIRSQPSPPGGTFVSIP